MLSVSVFHKMPVAGQSRLGLVLVLQSHALMTYIAAKRLPNSSWTGAKRLSIPPNRRLILIDKRKRLQRESYRT